jgi:hypothetical protein
MKNLILGAIDIKRMKYFVDAAFAVHPDMKSHTGGVEYVPETEAELQKFD